ncbi:MAG: YraN family protein [Firmicutes bacterium]|nr:YraN family protein [Bacillota bacterium]
MKGDFGERLAAKFLEKNGFEILATNYRIRGSEVDIIAREGEYTVFVEVKLRKNRNYGEPCEAVDIKKQRKIISAANRYIQENNIYDSGIRFDVIEIVCDSNVMRHVRNAFEVTGDETY